jgi:hypothetical protein
VQFLSVRGTKQEEQMDNNLLTCVVVITLTIVICYYLFANKTDFDACYDKAYSLHINDNDPELMGSARDYAIRLCANARR